MTTTTTSDGGDNGSGPDAVVRSLPFYIGYADFRALLSARRKRVLRGWAAHLIIILAANLNIGISAWLVALHGRDAGGVPVWCWFNAALGILILFVSYLLGPFLLERQYRKLGFKQMEMRFQADRNGFSISRAGGESRTDWSVLDGYAESPQHFFFFPNKLQGYILPKRALSTPSDGNHLRAWLDAAGTVRKGQATPDRRNGD